MKILTTCMKLLKREKNRIYLFNWLLVILGRRMKEFLLDHRILLILKVEGLLIWRNIIKILIQFLPNYQLKRVIIILELRTIFISMSFTISIILNLEIWVMMILSWLNYGTLKTIKLWKYIRSRDNRL